MEGWWANRTPIIITKITFTYTYLLYFLYQHWEDRHYNYHHHNYLQLSKNWSWVTSLSNIPRFKSRWSNLNSHVLSLLVGCRSGHHVIADINILTSYKSPDFFRQGFTFGSCELWGVPEPWVQSNNVYPFCHHTISHKSMI